MSFDNIVIILGLIIITIGFPYIVLSSVKNASYKSLTK